MMTHRQRILKDASGEAVDKIPWVPRIDLWHNANELAGTLPKKYRGLTVEEIHRKQGWPLHKMIPEYRLPLRHFLSQLEYGHPDDGVFRLYWQRP